MAVQDVLKGAAVGLLMLAGLSGCGGGGSPAVAAPPAPPSAPPESGELALTLTDAPGDFVAYIVDVTSIRLERANGDRVEALPLSTRVDFTRLAEVSELLTVATVPAGSYDEVVLTLDFSDAEVLVQGDDGEPAAARVVDADGDALSTMEVALRLEGDAPVRITPGTVQAFSLDFDLDATNTIDPTTAPPTVVVQPVLLAAAELEEDREHRVRGLLADVDETGGEVILKVRPFRHRTGSFGRFAFAVRDDTAYEIDGVAHRGGDGLARLAGMAEDTPLVVRGTVVDGELLAASVLAGSSVYWSDAEVVQGVVTARGEDRLTLSGVAAEFADGRYEFRREITVLLGADTQVSAPGMERDALDQLSLSVGQRIVASGEFVDAAAGGATLDASQGRVRMLLTGVWADVVSADPLVLDLHLLGGRRPLVFDFGGTGVSAEQDADPGAYQVDTAALGLLDLEADDLVQVRGLVNRFGFAAPDFLARTVVDVETAARGATARAGWRQGSATPFAAVSPERLDLALQDGDAVVALQGRLRGLPLRPDALALIAPDDGRGIYAVAERGAGTLTLYGRFADAVGALTEALDGGARLRRLTAHGRYTEDNDELMTVRASFVLQIDRPDANGG